MYKIISITNRKLCKDFYSQINKITAAGVNTVILREKDIPEYEYEKIAAEVIKICSKNKAVCILHSFISVAERLNHRYIHLPMDILKNNAPVLKGFDLVGASCHSVEEAVDAESLGANYITASHIYATDCKKGLEPKGTVFLADVCRSVNIPVYALGGITIQRMPEVMECGAAGGCIMSGLMTCDNAGAFLRGEI